MSPGMGTGIPVLLPRPARPAGLPWHPGDAKAWHWHSPEGGGHRELPGAFLDPIHGFHPQNPQSKGAARGVPMVYPPGTRSSDPLGE